MSENTTDATDSDEDADATSSGDGSDGLGDKGKQLLSDAVKRGKAAEQTIETQKRELEKLQKRLKSFEDRDKTDEQRRADELEAVRAQVTAAEEREAKANATLLRYQVGVRKGLPAKWINRLVGDTEDELEAYADEILEDLPAAEPTPHQPAPDRSLGRARGGKPSTAEQFAAVLKDRL